MAVAEAGFGRFYRNAVDLHRLCSIAALTMLIAIPMVGSLAALGFLAAGLGLCALSPRDTLREAVRFWPLLALPTFATLSLLWSEAPAASLRFGLQLGITALIAILLARHMPLRSFLTVTLCVLAGVVGMSIIAGSYRSDTGALTGFYASKNAMGQAAAVLALIGAGYAGRGRGVIASGIFIMGLLAVTLAQSMSGLSALIMAALAILAVRMLQPLRPVSRMVASLFCFLAGILAMILAVTYFDAVAELVLRLTGKDVTLTGRTQLWSVAMTEIRERPLLGVGFQAFWLPGNPTAEALWRTFGIEARTGFHFHSTFLSNAVEIGIPAVTYQTGLLIVTLVRSARLALAQPGRDSYILFGLVAMVAALTPVEVPVFFQFSLTTVLLMSACVYSTQAITAGSKSDRPA